MAGKEKACCEGPVQSRVESILNIDERGQMVLPKELRERAGIKPGDKFAVVSHLRDSEVCCITLMRAEALNEVVKDVLGPVMKDIVPG